MNPSDRTRAMLHSSRVHIITVKVPTVEDNYGLASTMLSVSGDNRQSGWVMGRNRKRGLVTTRISVEWNLVEKSGDLPFSDPEPSRRLPTFLIIPTDQEHGTY